MKGYAKAIAKILLESKEYLSSDLIAKRIGVSSRTVKRYMKDSAEILESYGCRLISTNKGYKVELDNREHFLNAVQSENVSPYSEDILIEMIIYILTNEFSSIDVISETLYCSRNTVAKKIAKVKEMLCEFDLELLNKSHYGFFIDGNEVKIRNCLVKYLDIQSNYVKSKLELVSINESFQVDDIKKFLIDALQQNHLIKSMQEVDLFVKYVVVTLLRKDVTVKDSLQYFENDSVSLVSFQVTNEVLTKLKKKYGVSFSGNDLLYLAIVLGGNDLILDDREMMKQNITNSIKKIEAKFHMYFIHSDQLITSLTDHICSSFRRFKLGIHIDNPLLYVIKSKYLQAFNYGVEVAAGLSSTFNIRIDENEIGYLALHFVANMENQSLKEKYKVIVVCSGGLGTSNVLKIKLASHFPQIYIKSVVPQYLLYKEDLHDIDFIISTIPIEEKMKKKVVYVNVLLNDEDKEVIQNVINHVDKEGYIKNLFRDELFFHGLRFENKEQFLHYITDTLITKKELQTKHKDLLFAREQMSPTELGNFVVIPHCIVDDFPTKLITCVLDKPIKWGKEQAQVIFIGCVNTKDTESKKIFPTIYKLTKSKGKMEALLKAKDCNEFVSTLFTS